MQYELHHFICKMSAGKVFEDWRLFAGAVPSLHVIKSKTAGSGKIIVNVICITVMTAGRPARDTNATIILRFCFMLSKLSYHSTE
ncbi:hypothetical protein CBW53_22405 [Yersinia frederiksenii]|nr:hypothetical protein CBW53_22405 [Yersinia frederiksenii]